MAFDGKKRWKQSERVASRRIGEELLLVPIRSDPSQPMGVYNLNPTAATLWESLAGGKTLDELVDALVDRFEVDEARARADAQTCCEDLLTMDAIETVTEP